MKKAMAILAEKQIGKVDKMTTLPELFKAGLIYSPQQDQPIAETDRKSALDQEQQNDIEQAGTAGLAQLGIEPFALSTGFFADAGDAALRIAIVEIVNEQAPEDRNADVDKITQAGECLEGFCVDISPGDRNIKSGAHCHDKGGDLQQKMQQHGNQSPSPHFPVDEIELRAKQSQQIE